MNPENIIEKLISILKTKDETSRSFSEITENERKKARIPKFQLVLESRDRNSLDPDGYEDYKEIIFFEKYGLYIEHCGKYNSYAGLMFNKPAKNNIYKVTPVEVRKIEYQRC